MRIISYNLRKHRAVDEIEALIAAHAPDVVCLQEADVDALPERVGAMELAHATSDNRLGLAVYHRPDTYRAVEMRAIGLKKSLHDRILRPAHERVVAVRLHDIDDGFDMVVSSFHAAPLTAPNSLRRAQIRSAITESESLGRGLPVLMVGDYNYPVFKEHLGQTVREHGYALTLSDDRTYRRYRVFRGHYDFVVSVGFRVEEIRTLSQGKSDHRPILVTATRAEASRSR